MTQAEQPNNKHLDGQVDICPPTLDDWILDGTDVDLRDLFSGIDLREMCSSIKFDDEITAAGVVVGEGSARTLSEQQQQQQQTAPREENHKNGNPSSLLLENSPLSTNTIPTANLTSLVQNMSPLDLAHYQTIEHRIQSKREEQRKLVRDFSRCIISAKQMLESSKQELSDTHMKQCKNYARRIQEGNNCLAELLKERELRQILYSDPLPTFTQTTAPHPSDPSIGSAYHSAQTFQPNGEPFSLFAPVAFPQQQQQVIQPFVVGIQCDYNTTVQDNEHPSPQRSELLLSRTIADDDDDEANSSTLINVHSLPAPSLPTKNEHPPKEIIRKRFCSCPNPLLKGKPYNPVSFEVAIDLEKNKPSPSPLVYIGTGLDAKAGKLAVMIEIMTPYGIKTDRVFNLDTVRLKVNNIQWRLPHFTIDTKCREAHRIPPTPRNEFRINFSDKYINHKPDTIPYHALERVFVITKTPKSSKGRIPDIVRFKVSVLGDRVSPLNLLYFLEVIQSNGMIRHLRTVPDCKPLPDCLLNFSFGKRMTEMEEEGGTSDPSSPPQTATVITDEIAETLQRLLKPNSNVELVFGVVKEHAVEVKLHLDDCGYRTKNDFIRMQAIGIFHQDYPTLCKAATAHIDNLRKLNPGVDDTTIFMSVEFPLRSYVIKKLNQLGSRVCTDEYLCMYEKTLYDRAAKPTDEQIMQMQDAFYWTHLAPPDQKQDYSDVLDFYEKRGLTTRLKNPYERTGESVGRTSASGTLREFNSTFRSGLGAAVSRHIQLTPDGKMVAKHAVKPREKPAIHRGTEAAARKTVKGEDDRARRKRKRNNNNNHCDRKAEAGKVICDKEEEEIVVVVPSRPEISPTKTYGRKKKKRALGPSGGVEQTSASFRDDDDRPESPSGLAPQKRKSPLAVFVVSRKNNRIQQHPIREGPASVDSNLGEDVEMRAKQETPEEEDERKNLADSVLMALKEGGYLIESAPSSSS